MNIKTRNNKIIILTVIFFIIVFSQLVSMANEITNAVLAGNTAKIKELLYKDPNIINIKDDKGLTPLHNAIKFPGNTKCSRIKLMELLIYGTVQITDWTINELYSNVDRAKLKKLINKKFTKDDLEKELSKSDFENKEIQYILEKAKISGADINAQDNDGKTPLHYAVKCCSKKEIELLLSNRAYVDIKDNDGRIPLYDAPSKEITELLISKGMAQYSSHSPLSFVDKEKIELLISKGVDVNIQDMYGMTMLHHAIRNSSEEVIKLLISEGADVNIKDYYRGNNPLHYAAVTVKNNKNKINLLLDAGADINTLNNCGVTPLCYAMFTGDISTIDFLISKGADINAKDDKGQTALHHMVDTLSPASIPYYDDIEKIEFLISRGADVTIKDNKGKTFLDMTHSTTKALLILIIISGILHRNLKIIFLAMTFVIIVSIILIKNNQKNLLVKLFKKKI